MKVSCHQGRVDGFEVGFTRRRRVERLELLGRVAQQRRRVVAAPECETSSLPVAARPGRAATR